jgi:hypothetical protein
MEQDVYADSKRKNKTRIPIMQEMREQVEEEEKKTNKKSTRLKIMTTRDMMHGRSF